MNSKKKKAAVKSIKKDINIALQDQLQEAMIQVVAGLGFDSKNTIKELKKASVKLATKITSKVKIIITKDEEFPAEQDAVEDVVVEEPVTALPVATEKKTPAPRKRAVTKTTI